MTKKYILVPIAERFWSKVDKTSNPNGCWEWVGGLFSSGYGKFKVFGKSVRAHRFSYELTKGIIPKGMLVCHHCDNPKCINPQHLFLGTNSDNTLDMHQKGRAKDQYGEKNKTAKLSIDSVRIIRESNKTQTELGKEFGVSRRCINKIINCLTWAGIK